MSNPKKSTSQINKAVFLYICFANFPLSFAECRTYMSRLDSRYGAKISRRFFGMDHPACYRTFAVICFQTAVAVTV